MYLIVVDRVIKKIDSSQARRGIKHFRNLWRRGVKGNLTLEVLGLCYFLYHAILAGKIESSCGFARSARGFYQLQIFR